jgi:hypothetical protein
VSPAGRLGVTFVPSGTEGYADRARGAVRFDIFGVDLLAASLADIPSKQAADRPQDRQDVVVLREMLRRGERAKPRSNPARPSERAPRLLYSVC